MVGLVSGKKNAISGRFKIVQILDLLQKNHFFCGGVIPRCLDSRLLFLETF